MAYRKVPKLPPEERAVILADVRHNLRQRQTTVATTAAVLKEALSRGFTADELAAETGVAPATLKRWARPHAA